MAVTKTYKVYGRDGHRQRLSFDESVHWDFSNKYCGTRIIEVDCHDKTGTNDYVIVRITRDTEKACKNEFRGQLSDGLFENCRYGEIVEL